jgi:hypothetical protein
LAGQHRFAASYDNMLIVDAGGLISYGPDARLFRQSARYIDKIKGEKPCQSANRTTNQICAGYKL